MRHAEKQESMSHALEKKKNKPRSCQRHRMSDLSGKDFKVAIIDMFTEIK